MSILDEIFTHGNFSVIPESPRWLYANHKSEKADVIVRKIAKYNKTEDKIPDKLEVTVKVWI